MSRRLWRCQSPGCPVAHGKVLGRLTEEGGLVLDPAVVAFRAFFDTKKVVVVCPACGSSRDFRGRSVTGAG